MTLTFVLTGCKFNVYQEEINTQKDTVQAQSDELALLKSNEESTDLSVSVEQVATSFFSPSESSIVHECSC